MERGIPTHAPIDDVRKSVVATRTERAEGKGPAVARHIGWRAASSPLIWFIDADCVAERDALARLLPNMDHPHVAGVGAATGIFVRTRGWPA